jgi:hypothetical protein
VILIVFDSLVVELTAHAAETYQAMSRRHANLQ